MVRPSHIEEVIDHSLPIPKAIEKLSLEKAQAIADRTDTPKDAVIIAADSVVVFGGQIYGKPKDKQDLIKTLTRLSGQTHQFITGFTIINMQGRTITTDFDIASVTLKKLSPLLLERHADRKSAYTKAGGYGITENGREFVQGYTGSRSNLSGLPLEKIEPILEQHGVIKRQ